MEKHFHVSGTQAIVTLLIVIVGLGSIKMLALQKPDNKFAQAWLSLF
jgi:hypothetical protein